MPQVLPVHNAQKLDLNKAVTYRCCDTGTVKVVTKHSVNEPAVEPLDQNQTRLPSPEVAMLQLVNLVATMSILLKPCWKSKSKKGLKVSFVESENREDYEIYQVTKEYQLKKQRYKFGDSRHPRKFIHQVDPFDRSREQTPETDISDRSREQTPEINTLLQSDKCSGCTEYQIVQGLQLQFVDAIIEDQKVSMLLDTGSTSTILSRDFLKHPLAQICTNPYMVLVAANKSTVNVMAHLTANITLHGMNYHHRFLVADLDKNILGLDFIKTHRLVIMPDPFSLYPITTFVRKFEPKGEIYNLSQQEIVKDIPMTFNTGIKKPEVEKYFTEMQQKYPGVFDPKIKFEDKHTVNFKVEIRGTYKKPYLYQFAYNLRDKVKEKISEMLENGIIEPSDSEYVMPAVIVPKKDGTIRFCVDFRALNVVTVPDNYNMPRIDEIKSTIKGNYFSTIDLKDGFYQIPVDPASKNYLTVATPEGAFRYVRMPFGARNAPSNFQRFMDSILFGMPHAQWYIDDVVIYSDTIEEHMEHVEEFFRRASKHGLNINTKKSQFFCTSIEYLGLEFDCMGYRPKPDVLPKIKGYPTPSDKKGIQKFMGLVNYYRDHIPALADVAAPLYDLLTKRKRFIWDDQKQKAFDDIKEMLEARITLAPIDPTLPFDLYTDASGVAIGACLMQAGRPVNFYSKKLSETAQRYSATMRETYGMVQAILHYRTYLFGGDFTVYTDHKPLVEWFSLVPNSETGWLNSRA